MSLQDRARYWNVTAEERAATYPCDAHIVGSHEGFVRAIDADTSAEVMFRWLCQLKVGPYAYNPLNLRRRRSPRVLTPGAEHLEVGQDFLVFRIVEFEVNRHISGVGRPEFERTYGPLAATYTVSAHGATSCRVVVKVDVGTSGPLGRVRRGLLAWGDLVMMRKQLRTLAELAEREPRQPGGRHAGIGEEVP